MRHRGDNCRRSLRGVWCAVAPALGVLSVLAGVASGGVAVAGDHSSPYDANFGPHQAQERDLPWGPTPSPRPAYARVAAITDLGRKLFYDPSLSASGKIACATCHDRAHGFAPANALPVQTGGAAMSRPGTRAAPALTYAQFSPFFDQHHYEPEDEGNNSVDQGPTGGFTWDGRATRARDQARIPLLSQNEMANANPAEVVARVRAAPYAAELTGLFGAGVLDDESRAFAAIAEALETYQQYPPEFSPFTSKFDAYVLGQAKLAPQEERGFALFNDPDKGNCAHCHKSVMRSDGPPLFTDYGFVAIGVPRNPAIPANADAGYFDLGLCGPARTDLAGHPEYCGMFKAPSLRNVALRLSFYHNGIYHSLEQTVAFYAERDTNPEKYYPRNSDGTVNKFDDLPAEYHANINAEPPFGRKLGDQPALSKQEIGDIVAFLQTLTDGYLPARATAAHAPSSTQ